MQDIKKVLSSYKQRFISPKSMSRTYFLTKLNAKNSIDLVELDKKIGKSKDLCLDIINFDNIEFEKKNINIAKANNMLVKCDENSIEEVRRIFPSFTKTDFYALESIKKNIAKKEKQLDPEYSDNEIIKEIEKLKSELNSQVQSFVNKYLKKTNLEFMAIEKLVKTSEAYIRETGKNDLWLGFPFVEGRFQSGKFFRAPLVLHRVEITKKQESISIKIVEGESIFNPVFLVAYYVENNLDHKLFDWDIKDSDFIKDAKKILKENDIKFIVNEEGALCFISTTKKDYTLNNVSNYNEFEIKNNVVLGQFPISDKNIYNDLQALEETEFEEEDAVAKFIKSNENVEDIFKQKEEIRAKEHEIKYITQLDYSQKNIVKEALEKNLVIEGPPGTGKSQVLSNIVANYVDMGKKILVVSEKTAALEVIYNRLGNLSNNALLIKNHINDKSNFYQQVSNAIDSISNAGKQDRFNSFSQMDSRTEKIFKVLEERENFYHEELEGFGLDEVLKHSKKNTNDFPYLKKYISRFEASKVHSFEICKSQLNEVDINSGIFEVFKNLDSNDVLLDGKYFNVLKYLSISRFDNDSLNKILFYCIMNDIEVPTIEVVNENQKAPMKSYKVLFEDISSLLNTESVIAYQKYKTELKKDVYKYAPINEELIKHLKKWDEISIKEKIEFIKRINDKNFKMKLFSSSKPHKALDDLELKLYTLIEETHASLNPQDVILSKLDYDLELMLDFLIDQKESDVEKIAINMFLEGIYNIDIGSLLNTYTAVKVVKVKCKQLDFEEMIKWGVAGITLLEKAYKDGIVEKAEMLTVIKTILVEDIYKSIKDLVGFFMEYDKEYSKTLDDINNKMLKSRITIENKLREEISIKGQTDAQFGRAVLELKRISNLKRRKAIADTTKKFSRELVELFPICLMTPGSVSAVLGNTKNMFDVVVFDEASQMFVENAVPSIHRAKNVIVAGDSKQLRPSSIFTQRFIEEEADEEQSYDVAAALEEESLLDYCKNKYSSAGLRYHYRSDHKELIEFSNRAFYNNKLIFSSNVKNNEKKPIRLFNVPGEWVDNTNIVEAEKVVELIKKELLERQNNETIGVITFNVKQRDLILNLIEEEATDNEELFEELARINEETGSDESLFVKNVENVQGDERDVIIFSVGYARDQKGKFVNQFGPITQATGENRLNVAITRAKKKICVVKSIAASVLTVREENRGNYFFKKYLQYVEKLHKEADDLDTFLNQLSDVDSPSEVLSDFDSPFEVEFYDELSVLLSDRYELRNQIKVGSFSIDFAVYDKEKEMFVLGIECDGAMYHSSKDAVEHDFYRQAYLESRGWTIHRVWSTNWWYDKKTELSKALNRLEVGF